MVPPPHATTTRYRPRSSGRPPRCRGWHQRTASDSVARIGRMSNLDGVVAHLQEVVHGAARSSSSSIHFTLQRYPGRGSARPNLIVSGGRTAPRRWRVGINILLPGSRRTEVTAKVARGPAVVLHGDRLRPPGAGQVEDHLRRGGSLCLVGTATRLLAPRQVRPGDSGALQRVPGVPRAQASRRAWSRSAIERVRGGASHRAMIAPRDGRRRNRRRSSGLPARVCGAARPQRRSRRSLAARAVPCHRRCRTIYGAARGDG